MARFLLCAFVLFGAAVAVPRALGHADHPGASVPVTSAPGFRLVEVGWFKNPTYVTASPGSPRRLFVVEQPGRIRVFQSGATLTTPFLDIRGLVSFTRLGEPGLLSVAFPPNYMRSGRFYILYSQRDENDIRIDELRRSRSDPNRADLSTRRKVLEIDHPGSTHFGGQLQFGPDGFLWISTGDGGGVGDRRNSGQRLDTLLGKVLRIDPRKTAAGRPYSKPPSNPFVGRYGRDEIWSYGLRNPWRFSFDRATGGLWLADVGQSQMEEVNHPSRRGKAANFGWRCFEGTLRYANCRAPGHVPPVIEYSHAGGSCSVTGGYAVRDPALPALEGRYVYGDYCTGALHAATLSGGRVVENVEMGLIVPRLTTFGTDGNGRLYAASRSGTIWRLVPGP
jgi:glucose/arabinose dehydrogenase